VGTADAAAGAGAPGSSTVDSPPIIDTANAAATAADATTTAPLTAGFARILDTTR
jgi:hypothetical protein